MGLFSWYDRAMKSSNKRKLLIVLGIIAAFIIILSITAFLLWQNLQPKTVSSSENTPETSQAPSTPEPEPVVDPYIGWATYTSQRDGYELKYPAEWSVIKESANDGPYIRNMQFTGGSYPAGYINLRVLRDEGTVSGSTLAPKEWYGKLGVVTVQKGPVTFTPDLVEDFTLAGFEAKKAKSIFSEIDEDVFFLDGDVLYEINMYPYGASANPVVKKMLDSFSLL